MTQPKYTVHLYNPTDAAYEKFQNKTPRQAARLWAIRPDYYLTVVRDVTPKVKVVFKAAKIDGKVVLTHRRNGVVHKIIEGAGDNLEVNVCVNKEEARFALALTNLVLAG